MLRLLAEVDSSYRFAKKFNADKELRMGLWKVGQSHEETSTF
jgi:brefeldin A-inhibited guanine nucleotide-exchange protein